MTMTFKLYKNNNADVHGKTLTPLDLSVSFVSCCVRHVFT